LDPAPWILQVRIRNEVAALLLSRRWCVYEATPQTRSGKPQLALAPSLPAFSAGRLQSHIDVAGAQPGLLASCADTISQWMHSTPIDLAHIAAMATIASTLSGSMNAVWLDFLEENIPGSSARACVAKAACDYIFCATLFNSAYLALVPVITGLFSGASPEEALALWGWTSVGFQSSMLLEACTFSPYNVLAFRAVPPKLRPLSSAALSATCTIVISGLTMGFDWL
jgi:hypothetical protein